MLENQISFLIQKLVDKKVTDDNKKTRAGYDEENKQYTKSRPSKAKTCQANTRARTVKQKCTLSVAMLAQSAVEGTAQLDRSLEGVGTPLHTYQKVKC